MFESELDRLASSGLSRHIEDRASAGVSPARIIIGGRELLNFSSNDYLGFSRNPETMRAASEAVLRYGAGAGSARLLAGGCTALHGELEARLAHFKGRATALLFGSGWHANAGAIPVLAGRGDAIFSDELNHASIIDGCRLSGAEVHVYKHADVDSLKGLLEGCKPGGRKLIITEAVFSMDGDIAPLPEIFELAREDDALVYVDEAHSIGVFGGGAGIRSHFEGGLTPLAPWPGLIEMGTFSKAFGSFGAFITGEKEVTDLLVSSARTFMFSTALPPACVEASLASLELIQCGKAAPIIKKLWENAVMLKAGICALMNMSGCEATPIVPLYVKTVEDALRLSTILRENGIYAPAIRPPTVKTPRLRLSVTASHSKEDLESLLDVLKRNL